jgi:hypothetical protein
MRDDDGMTLQAIADQLTAEGVPDRSRRRRAGGPRLGCRARPAGSAASPAAHARLPKLERRSRRT